LSRLNEIIQNHENMEQLYSIIKHHGVNAEFVSLALLEQLKQNNPDENSEENNDENATLLIEDLTQYNARF
jgi:hypothetical protein